MSIAETKLWKKAVAFVDRYSIFLAAVVIYAYYLLTSIDLIRHAEAKRSFIDYILQFDSLIFMWVIAAVIMQLQKYRKHQAEEQEYRRRVEHQFERQQIHLKVLDEVTARLEENINSPLATISISAHTLRMRFETDAEINAWLDRIDTSLQRIQMTIADIKMYQTQKIVREALPARENGRLLV